MGKSPASPYAAEFGKPRRTRPHRDSIALTGNRNRERPGTGASSAVPDRYRLAILVVLASSVFNSVNGLLLRSIEEANPWQIIAIRSGALAAALTAVFLFQQRHEVFSALRRLSWWGVLGAVMLATTNTAVVWSMSHTTIANTMFILSAVPFFTALLGWIFLRERVGAGLWVAMLIALAGIAIMLGDGLGGGTLFGNALAVLAAFSFACVVVVLRHGRNQNMLPIVVLGSLLACGFSSSMSGMDLVVPVSDFAIAFAWGGIISATVHGLFVWGSRYVQGAELTLVVLLEFILAPLWVWLAFSERPSLLTLAGGALVLAAVGSRGILALRDGD